MYCCCCWCSSSSGGRAGGWSVFCSVSHRWVRGRPGAGVEGRKAVGGKQPFPTCTCVITRKWKTMAIHLQTELAALWAQKVSNPLGLKSQTRGRPPDLQEFFICWEKQSGGERRGKERGCSLQLWLCVWVVGGLRGGVTDCLRQQGRKT